MKEIIQYYFHCINKVIKTLQLRLHSKVFFTHARQLGETSTCPLQLVWGIQIVPHSRPSPPVSRHLSKKTFQFLGTLLYFSWLSHCLPCLAFLQIKHKGPASILGSAPSEKGIVVCVLGTIPPPSNPAESACVFTGRACRFLFAMAIELYLNFAVAWRLPRRVESAISTRERHFSVEQARLFHDPRLSVQHPSSHP